MAALMFGEQVTGSMLLLDGLICMLAYKSASSHRTVLGTRGNDTVIALGKLLSRYAVLRGSAPIGVRKELHQLEIQQGRGKRPRRIASSYKQSLVEATHKTQKRTTPDQVMEVTTSFRPIEGEHVVKRGVANTWTLVHALDYVLRTREKMSESEVVRVSIACDGARLGGEEIVSLVLIDSKSDFACWLCPQ
eukprot:6487563-Amphidinium_carterae.1